MVRALKKCDEQMCKKKRVGKERRDCMRRRKGQCCPQPVCVVPYFIYVPHGAVCVILCVSMPLAWLIITCFKFADARNMSAADVKNINEEVMALYKAHSSKTSKDVAGMLSRYVGREGELLALAKKKFKVEL